MPGMIVFKPIEAHLTHNTELIGKMNPYCTFQVGGHRFRGETCKKGGKYPHWNDVITAPMSNESHALVEVMDKDKITHDDHIGSVMVDLQELQSRGQMSGWYPLYHKNKHAGELLMEVAFQPGGNHAGGNFTSGYQQEKYRSVQPGASAIISEQTQVVEPHKFVQEVEVVETQSDLKEIEVMEPVKVTKEVPVTEAVPVKKYIEVAEPHVVKKEIEVIEPQLVTKTIQVVENVPVKKEVEVVELKKDLKEVETMEPQTHIKQVEVTEFVPTRKQVEVTHPVTVKKAVECVEPVVTTQTVTKEVQHPVIVDEKVTTTVGPAGIVGQQGRLPPL